MTIRTRSSEKETLMANMALPDDEHYDSDCEVKPEATDWKLIWIKSRDYFNFWIMDR